MKILLLGQNGQVGWELQRSLAPLGELLSLDTTSLDYCGDLNDFAGLVTTIRRFAPDVIVNAAAYTSVDKAETEYRQAQRINADAVSVLAQEAGTLGALLVHYSTDYVFSGEGKKPWSESDPVAPLNAYGASKLGGELAIKASGCAYLIFRTSWVYAARGENFTKTIIRLARERDNLSIIDDQFGAPTGADLIADVTAHAIRLTKPRPELCGLYHLVAGGETTWFGYAGFVLNHPALSGLPLMTPSRGLIAVPTDAYPTAARRPSNSRLETQKLKDAFALELPDWRMGVARMLRETIEGSI